MNGYPSEPVLAFTFGPLEIGLAAGIIILLFGAKKLPLIARGLGSGIRNFRGELSAPKDEGASVERLPASVEHVEVEQDPK